MAFHLNGYSNFHDDNQDFILSKIKSIEDTEAHTEDLAEAAQNSADASQASAEASQASADASQLSAEASQQSAQAAAEDAESLAGKAEQVDINTARINNILVQGTPTEGNAELIDIRVGANGVTYQTAGDAVRGQYNALDAKIDSVENLDSVNVNVFTFDDFLNGAVTDDVTFQNPTQTTSGQFKYIKFTNFLETEQPFINVDAGENHVLAIIGLYDENDHQVWWNNGWNEITSGTFNYIKKDVADAFDAKTMAMTIIVSTTTQAADRIVIPSDTVCTVYYEQTTELTERILKLENGAGNFVKVAPNSMYTTIQAAIDATIDGDTILIYPGVYNEAVEMFGKNRNLVGVDRDTCIIYSGSGLYDDPALEANIGSVKNLTLISGNDDNLSEDSRVAKAYAMHIEFANTDEYSLNIENCNLISYLHCAVGMGVRYNQHVNFNNCYFETKCSQTYSYATDSFIPSSPVLFHNDSLGSDKGGNGSLHISKCELVGKTAVVNARSMDNGNNLTVRFDRTLGYYTDVTGVVVNYWGSMPPIDNDHFAGSDIMFDKNSYGNNKNELNYQTE